MKTENANRTVTPKAILQQRELWYEISAPVEEVILKHYLLSGIRWQAEYEKCEKRHHEAGKDDVVHVVQGFPANHDRNRDIRKGLRAAGVGDNVADQFSVQQIPLSVRDVI